MLSQPLALLHHSNTKNTFKLRNFVIAIADDSRTSAGLSKGGTDEELTMVVMVAMVARVL